MAISPADYSDLFDECRTIEETNILFKSLCRKYEISLADDIHLALEEAHRRALESLSAEVRIVAVSPDEDKIPSRRIRNWCAKQGIPLAKKGRVPADIEDQYRASQGLPLLPSEPPPVSISDTGTDWAGVRAWASSEGIQVPSRGRVGSDIIRAYVDAH